MPSLDPLLPHLPAWLLVLFRLTGIFVFAPMLGSSTIPARVKVLLALGLSFCVYPTLLDPGAASAAHVLPVIDSGIGLWSMIGAVASELLIGIIIGFGASLPIMGMQIGGHVIDQQVGLGLAGVFNPELNEQSGIIGEFAFLLALNIFIILGGHRVMLGTLVESFHRVPLAGFYPDGQVIRLVLGLMGSMFELALRVAAPLLCLVFLETIAMGFIARTVPQMNILSIGFPLRILIGFGLLVATVGIMTGVFTDAARSTMHNLRLLFAGT